MARKGKKKRNDPFKMLTGTRKKNPNELLEKRLDSFKSAYGDFLSWADEVVVEKDKPQLAHANLESFYGKVDKFVDGFLDDTYKKDDIEFFVSKLSEFKDHDNFSKSGLFTSNVINKVLGSEQAVKLDVSNVPAIDYMGVFHEQGRVEIIGDVGDHCAQGMCQGKVVVRGNVGDFACAYTYSGQAAFTGDVGDNLCYKLFKGRVVANNVGDYACEGLENGRIIVWGNVGDNMSKGMKGGRVIVRKAFGDNIGEGMTGGNIHYRAEPDFIKARISKDFQSGAIHKNRYHETEVVLEVEKEKKEPGAPGPSAMGAPSGNNPLSN